VLIGPTRQITIDLGFGPMLYAFAAAILGSMGRLGGVVVGALAIGLVQQLGAGYMSPEYADIYPFVLMLAVIAVRPQGLFGSETGARL
jgi:branched-chain amino acid transport system permease protein